MTLLKPFYLAILSGVLISFSYIPFYAVVGLFALIPLWLALEKAESYKEAFFHAWLAQFIFSLIGFHWIAHTAHEFGYMPWSLSILVLLVFASVIHLHFPLAAIAYLFLKKKLNLKKRHSDLVLLSSFFLAETYWPMLFPWNFGYTWMKSDLFIKQTAELWGFIGISFFVMLANLFLLKAVREKQSGQVRSANKIIFGFLTIFMLFNILGYALKASIPSYDKKWNIGLIQANIGNFEKVQAETGGDFQRSIADRYLGLSKKLTQEKPNLDLLIWPETAIPISMSSWNQHHFVYRKLLKEVNDLKTPLLSGSFLSESRIFNAAVLIDEKGILKDTYKKNMLLAWGETVPFTDPYPNFQDRLKELLPALSFFGQGEGPKVLEVSKMKLGLNICYEGIHPLFMAEVKDQGANVFINLTNDSWFGKSFEPYQHMYMTMARAIEFRIPVVRSTNTGISTVARADGKIEQLSSIHEEWTGAYAIQGHENPPVTLYQRIANWVPLILVLISLLSSLLPLARDAKNESL